MNSFVFRPKFIVNPALCKRSPLRVKKIWTFAPGMKTGTNLETGTSAEARCLRLQAETTFLNSGPNFLNSQTGIPAKTGRFSCLLRAEISSPHPTRPISEISFAARVVKLTSVGETDRTLSSAAPIFSTEAPPFLAVTWCTALATIG